jgi:hypothetical protein
MCAKNDQIDSWVANCRLLGLSIVWSAERCPDSEVYPSKGSLEPFVDGRLNVACGAARKGGGYARLVVDDEKTLTMHRIQAKCVL